MESIYDIIQVVSADDDMEFMNRMEAGTVTEIGGDYVGRKRKPGYIRGIIASMVVIAFLR